MIALGELFLDSAVEILVLEEEHTVLITNRRLEETLGITGGSWIYDFQPRRVQDRAVWFVRGEWPAAHIPAARAPNHHRTWKEGSIARGCDIVGEHIIRGGYEVYELQLTD